MRRRRVDALVPGKLATRLKVAAAMYHVTQQHLLRLFLLQYLAAAPWERKESRAREAIACD